jgi:predicted RND superfamily exporter protein
MEITQLILSTEIISNDEKLSTAVAQFNRLLDALRQKQLPESLITKINAEVIEFNSSALIGKELLRLVKKKQNRIVTMVMKGAKITPINYYRNVWFALGMTVFGLPIGMAISLALGNMALLGIGFPFGLMLGLAVGISMDKKAKQEGRQLDIELR